MQTSTIMKLKNTHQKHLGEQYFDFVEAVIAKTVNENSLLQEILYFLEDMFTDYPDGFAKHFEPREDQDNLDGACWEDLLQTSKHRFTKCFDLIGAYYPSEKALNLHRGDKFQGKFYYRVVKSGNRTYYFRNHKLINAMIEQLVKTARTGDLGLEE